MNSLTLNAVTEVPWVGTWLKGQAELSSQDYANAIATFKTLDTVHHLKENSSVLVNMAYCHNYLYQTHKAIYCLQRVRHNTKNETLQFFDENLSILKATRI